MLRRFIPRQSCLPFSRFIATNPTSVQQKYQHVETPIAAEVRNSILGSGKVSVPVLKAYCTAFGLGNEGSQKELYERVKKHVTVDTARYSVFALGWDTRNANLISLLHGSNKETIEAELDKPASMAALKSWVTRQCIALGPNVVPVVLPMYTDQAVDKFKSLTGITVLQDAMGMCTSIFFDHVSRVKGLPKPRDLNEVYGVVCGEAYPGPTKQKQSLALRNAKLCWDATWNALRHLGSKLTPEEQMLQSIRVSVEVFMVKVALSPPTDTASSVLHIDMYCGSTRKSFKHSAKDLSEATRAVVQYLADNGKRNVVMLPCFKTRTQDIANFVRQNNHPHIRLHVMDPSDIVTGLQVLSEEPKDCWKQLVKDIGKGEESIALKVILEGSLGLMTRAPTRVNTPLTMSSTEQVEKIANQFKQIGKKKVQFEAEKEYINMMRILMSPERRAREEKVAERHRKYLVLDLETTTKKLHKRVASPFDKNNRVVLPGMLDYTGKLTIPDHKYTSREEMRLPSLDDYDVLVGHNIKFDLLYLWQDTELKKFLQRGGRVWDTLYAEYLLSGQRVRVGQGAGLSDVAVKYGGTRKIDAVKALWDQGIDTSDIDHALLAEYLEGDLRNTELVFRKQIENAVEGHQALIIEARSDVVLCTTEMEFNGLSMDAEEGKRQHAILRKSIEQQKANLINLMPSEVPPYCYQHFNWNSTAVLGAVYFGGDVQIAPDKALGMPLDSTAAVELAVRAENATGCRKGGYGSAYLQARGLRASGRGPEVDERIKSFVKNNTTFRYKLVLAGLSVDRSTGWLYNPLTDTTLQLQDFDSSTNLSQLLTLSDEERVLLMLHDGAEFQPFKELCEKKGISLPVSKWFNCTSRGLGHEDHRSSNPPNSMIKGQGKEMWIDIADRIGGESEAEVIDKIFTIVGKSVGSKNDCFANPIPEGASGTVKFPGRVYDYFPDTVTRVAFIQKSMTATQKAAVSVDVLEAFAQKKEPIAAALLKLREDQKLLGTYYEFQEGTGMMSLVNTDDQCIHHELQCQQTITSRMASSNPNMQNVPKTDGLRKLFVSRYGKEGVLVEADYSQLEVIVMCALAKDPQMTEDLRQKIDFHCKRVTLMRPGVTYEEVVQKAKKEEIKEWKDLRQKAKIFSFQRQYGAGVAKLSESTGLTQDEVRELIKKENETYWRVKQFYDVVNHAVMMWSPELQDASRTASGQFAYKGEFRIPTGTRFTFGEVERSPEMMAKFGKAGDSPMSFLSTQLKNYPVQGFAGEIVQVMLGKLYRHFLQTNNYDGKAVLVNTVHDCVWVDCHQSVYKQVGHDVERILSAVTPEFNGKWPELELEVTFGAEVVAGRTMAGMKGLEKFNL